MIFQLTDLRTVRAVADAREAAVQLMALWLHEDDCTVLLEATHRLEDAVERLWDITPDAFKKTNLGRHVHFLGYYLKRSKKEACTSDIVDVVSNDLPAIEEALREEALKTWKLDAGLRKKTLELLEAGHGTDAVRNAFLVLSDRLRLMRRGLRQRDGHALVEELFNDDGRLVPYMSDGPRRALRHLLLGLYSQFRNPHAHRSIDTPVWEAAGVVVVIDSALRDLAKIKKLRRKRGSSPNRSGRRATTLPRR